MSERPLPPEVARFIDDYITSIEQLEILLLLRRAPGQDFSARRVSEVIRTSETSASARLADLASRGLLAADGGAPPQFRYSPSGEALDRTVSALASAYTDFRYRVIDAILAKPTENLRVYADAFRLKKDRNG